MNPKAEPLADSTIIPKGRGCGLPIAVLIAGLLLVALPFVALALRPADVEMTWLRWTVVLACSGLVGLLGAGLAGLGIYLIRHRQEEPPQTDFGRAAEFFGREQFQPVEAILADEAVGILVRALRLHTPHCSEAKIRRDFATLQTTWSARELFQGSDDELYNVLLWNLRSIRETPGFRVFKISVMLHDNAAQVDALFPHRFVGIRVWKSGSVCFACGNSDFRRSPPIPPA